MSERAPMPREFLYEEIAHIAGITAFLVLLETLSPRERAVFLLHDVFDYNYPEIAEVVGTSEANCRQIATRARRRIAIAEPRFETSTRERDRLAERFLAASRRGDVEALVAMLADDATFVGDGGTKGNGLARPVVGGERVGPLVANFTSRVEQKTVLLTTFRRDGTPVGTPLSVAVDGARAYFRTFEKAGKAKRLRNDGRVELTPSVRGQPRPIGSPVGSPGTLTLQGPRAVGSPARYAACTGVNNAVWPHPAKLHEQRVIGR